MRADVMITNLSKQRADVLPNTFTLDILEPKPKSLPYESPEQLAKAIDRKIRWRNALAGMAANMATQQSTSTSTSSIYGNMSATNNKGDSANGIYNGSSTTNTTANTPDYAARHRANQQAAENIQTGQEMVDYINRATLKANTLMPGQDVFGVVFFKREKDKQFLILRIPIGRTVFEFPVSWGK
jgi:hypothetical protein